MSESNERDLGFDGLLEAADADDAFDWEQQAEQEEPEEATISVLRFVVGEREFAVRSEVVREIVSELNVTRVPGAPKHIGGVGVLRRQVIGVLDLNQWLDPVAESGIEEAARVIIVEAGGYTVGIEVNAVAGLDDWPEKVLDKSRIPGSINTRTRRYAAGVRLSDDEAVVLLDAPRLLDDAAVQ